MIDNRPDPERKGETFNQFVKALKRFGYKVDWRELRACDYGAPTIRKRFFLIARCDGKPIVWPEPTHGDPDSLEVHAGLLQPWRTAAECIDWTIPCPSIFERKKPLAENTLKRIAKGIQKFVIDNPKPFIVRICQTGFGGDGMQYSIDQPLTTIVSKAEHCLVAPFLTQYHSYDNEPRGQVLDKPLLTIDTSNRYGLVTSNLVQLNNNCDGVDIRKPMPTITAGGGHLGEVRAFLMSYYGNGNDIGQRLDEPLRTITAKDRFGIVTVAGQDYQIVDIGMRMLEPHELFKAQGFPDDYIIDREYTGKEYPKTQQVARCGNSVCPPIAKALVEANLPEMCRKKEQETG